MLRNPLPTSNRLGQRQILGVLRLWSLYTPLKTAVGTRPREDRVGGEWCPTAIREMLKNELYIGNVVWNRSKFVKVPGNGSRTE
jgi:hypothetical protein